MTNQLTESPKKQLTIRDHLGSDRFRQQVAAALPKHLTAERFARVALTAINRTPKLMECTQESLFACLLDLSALGLEPDGRRAHLIPYGRTCTLIIDYKGIAELAMRSGAVSSIHADKVCENDDFDYDRGQLTRHKIDFRKPRGDAFAYYALIRLKDGTEKCEVMTNKEIDAIRKRSKSSGSGPWVTDYDEMAKKTVFKRASKWIPLSPEIRDAIQKDDEEHETTVVAISKPLFESPAGLLPGAETPVIEAGETREMPANATPREALANLMKASHVEEPQLLAYIAGETGEENETLTALDEQMVTNLVNNWPDIVAHITKGAK